MDKVKISRLQLYELVWSDPLTTLAKRYDISDVGLRKIRQKLHIPLPRSGHWQKVRAGKKASRIELPSLESNQEILLHELEKTEIRKEYPWTKLQLEIESDAKLNLTAPSKLHNPDKLNPINYGDAYVNISRSVEQASFDYFTGRFVIIESPFNFN